MLGLVDSLPSALSLVFFLKRKKKRKWAGAGTTIWGLADKNQGKRERERSESFLLQPKWPWLLFAHAWILSLGQAWESKGSEGHRLVVIRKKNQIGSARFHSHLGGTHLLTTYFYLQ